MVLFINKIHPTILHNPPPTTECSVVLILRLPFIVLNLYYMALNLDHMYQKLCIQGTF